MVFFVNSGSEANDLAMRLARAHTGRRGVITMEGAYHGHTVEVVHISPYKYDRAGGAGRPLHVKEAPLPCVYSGMHRGRIEDEGTGKAYAGEVHKLVQQFAAEEAHEEAMRARLRELLHQSASLPMKSSSGFSHSTTTSYCGVGGEVEAGAGHGHGSDAGSVAADPTGIRASSPTSCTADGASDVASVASLPTSGGTRPSSPSSSSSSVTASPAPSSSSSPAKEQGGSAPAVDAAMLSWLETTTTPADGLKAGLGAFIMESVLSCGGQVVPPAGYLRNVYASVRAAGGVCIADEVQVGFGRVGSSFWAFQLQGADVVPDILTLGKPMGNGVPIAAVVCAPEIAASFANGEYGSCCVLRGPTRLPIASFLTLILTIPSLPTPPTAGQEYFNTFGGNPVVAACALATLQVLQKEGMQGNAERVGKVLLEGFHSLQAQFPSIIGSVRGCGLMVGLEILKPPPSTQEEVQAVMDSIPVTGPARHAHPAVYSHGLTDSIHLRIPDPALASRLKYGALHKHAMLLSTDGMADNIVKLKPPMCFTQENAREVVEALRGLLGEYTGQGGL